MDLEDRIRAVEQHIEAMASKYPSPEAKIAKEALNSLIATAQARLAKLFPTKTAPVKK